MAPLAFGTQTAGSVIRPAAYCGCIGYKPSFGLINRAGVKPLADSLDTVGAFARTVEDAAFFAGVLSERPALRHLAVPSAAPRFGLCRTPMWDEAEPTTAAALDDAREVLERAGAVVAELAIMPEHHGLAEAQDTIMGFEMVRALAYERIEHSAAGRSMRFSANVRRFWFRPHRERRRSGSATPATRSSTGCGLCLASRASPSPRDGRKMACRQVFSSSDGSRMMRG